MTRRAKLVIGLVFAAFSLQLAGLLPVFPVLLDGLHLFGSLDEALQGRFNGGFGLLYGGALLPDGGAQTPFFFFEVGQKSTVRQQDMRR